MFQAEAVFVNEIRIWFNLDTKNDRWEDKSDFTKDFSVDVILLRCNFLHLLRFFSYFSKKKNYFYDDEFLPILPKMN